MPAALSSAGFVTPEQIASANVQDIVLCLERNLPVSLKSHAKRSAQEIQQKAIRHLERLSANFQRTEEVESCYDSGNYDSEDNDEDDENSLFW